MRRAARIAFVLLAVSARGQSLDLRGQFGWQLFDYGGVTRSGFRQTYDLGIRRAVTANSRIGLFVRADDFRGTTEIVRSAVEEESGTRQLQPVGEFLIDAETLRLQIRSDFLIDDSVNGARQSRRETERSSANFHWAPIGLPSLQLIANRNVIKEEALAGDSTDESLTATVQYPWRGLSLTAQGRHLRAADDSAGYDRTQNTLGGQVAWALSAFHGRFTFSADASAERSDIVERTTATGTTEIPVPIRPRGAYHVVDDTPLDDRDHPLVAVPALRDGSLDVLTSVSLGPESASFQNLALDFGRREAVDQIRVVVRNESGNPLRNGGGAIVWDAYVSEDGVTWTPAAGVVSRFEAPLSMYLVTFDEATTRWIKVVSFGVHFEPVFVTEMQAFDLTRIAPGTGRSGTQDIRSGVVSFSIQPVRRLSITYNGAYSSLRQRFAAFGSTDNTTLDQNAAVEYEIFRHIRLRTSTNRTDVRGYGFAADGAENLVAAIDYTPTSRLRATLETSRQRQTILGIESTISTRALRLYGMPLRAVTLSLDAGVQSQTLPGLDEKGERLFVNFATAARVTRTTRLTLNANIQRARDGEADPSTLLLGVPQDDRYSAEFTWQPGRPLLVSTRLGWSQNRERRGLTQRYRAEWFPFADGSISLAGSYDEDIDPLTDRRARRLVLNPRWVMSRFLILDLSYTAVDSEIDFRTDEQKTFYATLTVTK